MSTREEILSKVREVPSLPLTATRMLQLVQNPDTPFTEIQREVELDVTLASNILRLANSAYFAGSGPIASVRDAIVRLGTKRILQLVLTTSVAPLTSKPLKGYGLRAGGLLRHCAATAIGAEQLSRELQLNAPDYAYTAGLMHDIGKIVLGTYLEIDATPVLDLAYKEGLSFEVAEQRVLGVDHAEVGATLLEAWMIPATVVDVVRWHHSPDAYPGPERFVVDLIHVADHVARVSGTSAEADGMNYSLSVEAVERLGLKPAITETVVNNVLRSLDEICENLSQ
ncbi:MAG: HDOD domain-containing protein [Candidatus Hydrogenedentes bacterium]|nr:HDOD domain-containing protein [Candidatus Hydrogenedentota bacterium]